MSGNRTTELCEKLRKWVDCKHDMVAGHGFSWLYELTSKEKSELLKIADEIEAEIDSRYMLLPVDADGVPIHVGDVMCSAGIREKGHKVTASAIFEDGFVEYGGGNGLIGPLCQEDWVHAKPDPLKELLRDACMNATRICCEQGVGTNVHVEIDETGLAEYAERIRELMEAKEGGE